MTCQHDCSQFHLAMELLFANGFEGVAETIGILMNSAMQIERSRHLRANPYERTDARRDYANGYKPKNMKTRFGEVQLVSEHEVHWREFLSSLQDRGLHGVKLFISDAH